MGKSGSETKTNEDEKPRKNIIMQCGQSKHDDEVFSKSAMALVMTNGRAIKIS